MYNLGQLSRAIAAELIGDPDAIVERARPFDAAGDRDVTFAATPGCLEQLDRSRAAAVILKQAPANPPVNLLITANPKLAFARAISLLHGKDRVPRGVASDLSIGARSSFGNEPSIFPRVTIGCDSTIGDRVTLYPGVTIGDRCKIGDDSVLYPNVSIYDDSQIGSRVIIHSGAVVGAEGFSFVPDEQGSQVKLLQLGWVLIEDDCEIGANCTVDRGGFGPTVLRRGVKLDNLIQVGHNTEIGEDTVVAALTGFSGGTRVGRRCVIAGQVGTNQHISVGDSAVITARTGVTKSVKPGAIMGGMMPAQDYNEWRRAHAFYKRLPEIAHRLNRIEKLMGIGRRDPGEKSTG
jgi:UDP-3-O-[3-hydroxymyristoyl] glucosamine N-acyltransferase